MEKYVSKSNLQYNVDKTKQYVENKLEDKQDVLVSGENIKTINNTSLLGEGNIVIEGVTDYTALNNLPQINGNTLTGDQTSNELGLQDTLENQVNIKSINGNSLLGSGNLDIGTNQATYNDLGTIKLGSNTQSSQTIETASSTARRQYPVQVDSNGRASVNVPWTDTTYSNFPAEQDGVSLSLVTTGEKYVWNNKQNALTFDNSPTLNSNNPVKSNGIYMALNTKQDTLIAGSNITIANNVISSTTQTVLNGVAYREI